MENQPNTISVQEISGAGERALSGASHNDLGFFGRLWLATKITIWRGPHLLALYFVVGIFSVACLLILTFIFIAVPGFLKILAVIPAYLCGGAALISLQTGFMANCLILAADRKAWPSFALAFSGFTSFRSHIFLILILILLTAAFAILGRAFRVSPAAIIWPLMGLMILGSFYMAAYALFTAHQGKCSTDQALRGAFALVVRHPLQWLLFGLLMLLTTFLMTLLGGLPLLGLDYLGEGRAGVYYSTYTVQVMQTTAKPWLSLGSAFWLVLGTRLLVNFIIAVFGGLLAALTFRRYLPSEEKMTKVFD